MLIPGDPAPHFDCVSSVNPKFLFDTVAGRYIVLSFFGSSQVPSSERFLREIVRRGDRFDVANLAFFGVTNDPADVERIQHRAPGRIYLYDLDLSVSRKYGIVEDAAAGAGAGDEGGVTLMRKTFVLDHALRVVGIFTMADAEDDAARQVDAIFALIDSMPKPTALTGAAAPAAPVLIVPYVFEPELCQRLIDYYHATGAEDSGFMRDVNGKTAGFIDHAHKRRMDCEIVDDDLIRATQERIKRRVVPAIKQVYQFDVTRIERHIVACYDAAQGAHFRAHRDNTTLGTAHRRFAVTINLNSPEYEGGEIWFPEFGRRLYKAPSGAAIVFSCSLLHEVPKVTRGKRYAFLPFLYDDAAAALRARNNKYLGDLTGASGGRKVTNVCQSPAPPNARGDADFSRVVIDGSPGCGNPDGCETCLSAPTYQIGTPSTPAKDDAVRAGGGADAG